MVNTRGGLFLVLIVGFWRGVILQKTNKVNGTYVGRFLLLYFLSCVLDFFILIMILLF